MKIVVMMKMGYNISGVIMMTRKNPLVELRNRLGLKRRDLAMLLEISPESLWNAEKGARRDITNYEQRLKELGILKKDENIAEEYKRWKKEVAAEMQKEVKARMERQ